ncbi:MAG: YfhO family protein [Deltaproteobacteria bacterium]|nr:YfhO family protein [Deltaproteobacteria bacterium]
MALVLILISTWLATGLYGGLYDLHRLIPIVANLRAPARYLVLTQFGICLIAAIAFGDLVKKANKRRTSQWQEVLPWIITLLSILSAVFFANTASITPVSDKEAFFYPAPLFFFFAAIGLSLAIRGRKTGLFILVIIAFIDIGYYNFGLPVVRHTIFEARPYAQWKNKVEEPPYRGSGRVFYRDAMEDLLYLLDYSLINGYTGGMTPKKLLDYDDLDVLRIADVEWVFRGKSRPVGSRPGGRAHTDWIHVPNRLPKVRFATRTRVSHNPSRDIKKIDIKNTALVTRFTELKDGELGEAVVVGNKHGEIAIDAKTSSRQMLVLSESYHPEWQVFVDGKKDILYRVNGDFMGCILEKGKHKVNFIFIPYALTYGLPISIFGTSTTLLLCFIPFIARFISKRSNAQL